MLRSDPARQQRVSGADGPPPVAWSARDTVTAIIALVLILGFFLALLALTLRGAQAPEGAGLALSTIAGTVATEGTLVGLVVVYALRRGGTWSQLGFRPFSGGAFLPAGTVLILGFTVNVLYAVAIRTLDLEQFRPAGARELLPLFGGGHTGLIVGLLLAGILAPVAEELFFRGFIFGGLLRPIGFWGATAVSALVFAIVHMQVATVLPIFALGWLLAWLYHRTQSLWPPILVHATYNSIALIAAFAYPGATG